MKHQLVRLLEEIQKDGKPVYLTDEGYTELLKLIESPNLSPIQEVTVTL
ncbi:hypothetical protein [Chengkuizengella axinellae]|uniref:Fur-regulated basic protein FbpA n=1 Tax=Chengkuizengella axinellae TaxID=3064388 RepID=A0ABT9IYH9_9BACL|nr:hypothetical protein [Chengkuizengella sp. 2205SS18-9]MDP5274370.1 hypothetical protein [Chengkuizengella sp. 2205SS18-9]